MTLGNATDYYVGPFFSLDHLKWLYLSSEGRLNRKRYWEALFLLFFTMSVLIVVSSLFIFSAGSFGEVISPFLNAGTFISFVIAFILLLIKRAHDRDHSGWYILLWFVPLIGWFFHLELYFAPGTDGQNQYGTDPRQPEWNG